jgi:hypothetical protein
VNALPVAKSHTCLVLADEAVNRSNSKLLAVVDRPKIRDVYFLNMHPIPCQLSARKLAIIRSRSIYRARLAALHIYR